MRRRPRLEPGTKIGRYRVVDFQGEGGMGVVYRVRDPELNRDIALKLVGALTPDDDLSNSSRARMLREAQALAKLSHPSVVTVHDVGMMDNDLFIAMELVEGSTVKEWLRERERSVTEIVEVFVSAGEGLSAAHRVGIVHRDFKPANVIVGDDGRARVLDFGIARNVDVHGESDTDRSRAGTPFTPVTRPGKTSGTPAYMSLEQHCARPVDARSDQYSYCIALHEALEGKRPFLERSIPDLCAAMERGAPKLSRPGVPARVRKAVSRGLEPVTDARFETMDDLLAELRPRSSVVGVSIAVVAAAIIGALIAIVFAGGERRERPCTFDDTDVAGVWDEPTKEKALEAFTRTDRRHAERAFATTAAELDRRVDDWRAMRGEACEATRIRGEQSEELLDLRMICLDRRLAEIGALATVLADAVDGALVDGAPQAARSLPSLDSCANAEALRAAYPPPTDPETRDAVAAARVRIDEVRALFWAGSYQRALDPARAAVEAADSAGWLPARAEATWLLGMMQSHNGMSADADATLETAMKLSAEAKDDELFVLAGVERIYVLGYELAKPDDAVALAELLEPFVSRTRDQKWLSAKRLDTLGIVLWAMGKHERAQESFERALPLYIEARGPDDRSVAKCHTNLGNVLASRGLDEEAKAHYEQDLAIIERTEGLDHPEAARALSNLGTALHSLGDLDGAKQNYEHALGIWERVYGPNGMMVANACNNLGEVHHLLGDYDAALPYCKRALQIGEDTLPADHPIHAYHLQCMGHALTGLKRSREAADHLKRAIELREKAGGDAVELASARLDLADLLWQAGERRAAIDLATTARTSLDRTDDRSTTEADAIDTWLAAHPMR